VGVVEDFYYVNRAFCTFNNDWYVGRLKEILSFGGRSPSRVPGAAAVRMNGSVKVGCI
jgi:hypothetical protein